MPFSVALRAPSTLVLRPLAALVLLAAVLAGAPTDVDAAAQGGTRTLEVWGLNGGVVPSPKAWSYRQSTAGDDLGSATAADPALVLDGSWSTVNLRWEEIVGSDNANHFRKDFNLASLGVQLSTAESEQGLLRLQRIVTSIQNAVYRFEGSLNKLVLDDKGATLLCVWGISPFAH